jgi:hypothetical protein
MERCIEWDRLQRSLGGFTSVTGYAIGRPARCLICTVRHRKQRGRLKSNEVSLA